MIITGLHVAFIVGGVSLVTAIGAAGIAWGRASAVLDKFGALSASLARLEITTARMDERLASVEVAVGLHYPRAPSEGHR